MVSTNAGMNTPDRGASGVGVVNPRSPLVARGKYDPGNYRDDRGGGGVAGGGGGVVGGDERLGGGEWRVVVVERRRTRLC